MRTKLFSKRVIGTAIAVLCLIGIPSPSNSHAQTQPTLSPQDNATESGTLPSDIYPNSPLAQVVRLVQAGVEQSVILAYISNSGSPFNLGTDQIIYLNDIGAPKEIVTAMIQRDQELKQMGAATSTQTEQSSSTAEVATEQPAVVTQNYFYDTLSPYGSWVDIEGYGQCWRPTVAVYNGDWQPYCDHGHWVYTDCGWYWVSDYSWGSATFHYGRWLHDSRHGWCWWPDTTWGPSWVTWRYSGDYCGWAPLPPRAVYREGVGFFYNGAAVSIGFDFGLSWNCFAFVPIGHFCDPHPHHYRVAAGQATQIYNHTTVVNNFNVRDHNFVNRGIDPERITAVTRTPIHQVGIRETTTRVPRGEQFSRDNRTLTINRPNFAGAPIESLHQGVVPHSLQGTPNPSRNNFQRQPLNQNQNPRPVPGVSVPPVHNPQVGAPVQTPTPRNYNNDNRRFVSPKTQGQQTSRGVAPNLSEHGNATAEEHSVGSPVVNHTTPPVVPAAHSQNNYDTPRNASHYNDMRLSQPQTSAPSRGVITSSQISDRQDQEQDKRGR